MKRRIGLSAITGSLAVVMIFIGLQAIYDPSEMAPQNGYAQIFPDYIGVTIPPNTTATVTLPDGKRERVASGSYEFTLSMNTL